MFPSKETERKKKVYRFLSILCFVLSVPVLLIGLYCVYIAQEIGSFEAMVLAGFVMVGTLGLSALLLYLTDKYITLGDKVTPKHVTIRYTKCAGKLGLVAERLAGFGLFLECTEEYIILVPSQIYKYIEHEYGIKMPNPPAELTIERFKQDVLRAFERDRRVWVVDFEYVPYEKVGRRRISQWRDPD